MLLHDNPESLTCNKLKVLDIRYQAQHSSKIPDEPPQCIIHGLILGSLTWL